jgi:hypothetical protein
MEVGGADRCGSAEGSQGRGQAEAASKAAEKAADQTAKAQCAPTNTQATKPSPIKDTFTPAQSPAQPGNRSPSPSNNLGQRERALEVTRQAPACSVGAAINRPLEAFTAAMGNRCAGAVGDFYEQQRELLNSPATDANIKEFARREGDFFETQSGCSRALGGVLSDSMREAMIKSSRTCPEGE